MSSTLDPSSTVASSASSASSAVSTSDSSDSGGDGGSNTSSSLYLFTFLATLFLLLFVSCAIVLRSFVLRRRFRRRIEEAIAAGVWVPPQTGPGGTRHRRNFGEKPKLWDVWVSQEELGWERVMPVSVKTLSSDPPKETDETEAEDRDAFPLGRRATSLAVVGRALRNPFTRRNTPSSTTPSSSSLSPSPTPSPAHDDVSRIKEVQVTVLIAMPRPHPTSAKGKERSFSVDGGEWEEEEFPDVVMGVTQEKCRGEGEPDR